MSTLVRTLSGPVEVARARRSARLELIAAALLTARRHLLSDAALDRWYGPSPKPPSPSEAYGPAEDPTVLGRDR